jgi:CheY-like chemotaxis protein
MPVFDGPETVRAIRRISRDVPIVYISGSDPELIDLQEGEVQGVLAKPFSMEALLSAVREAIDLSR